MNLGMLSQNKFSHASIYTPQSMEIQRVSLQQVSPCVVLVKGTDAVTWNKLREIINKQDKQYVRKQLKGGGSGWLVKIQISKRLMAEISQLKMVCDAIPVFVREVQLPFNFTKYMEGLAGERGYNATGEVNTAETIRITRNSMTNGNRLFPENQVQEVKKIIRSLERLPGEVLTKLFEFQKEGVEFGIKRGCRVLIADEMGVGKTIQALSLAYIFKDEWPLLIICPSCLRLTFKQEIIQWFKNYIYENEIQVISKKTDKLLRSASIVIISYDMVQQLSEDIIAKAFQTCIIDEAHYLKSLESLRSLHVVPLAQKMKNVILLTGTPALARPKELFNILSILRPDVFKEFRTFGNRYCKPRVHQVFNQINYDGCDNEQELNFILQDRLMIRRSKEKILPDLPAKRRKKIIIEIAGSVKNKIKKVIGRAEDLRFQQLIEQYEDSIVKNAEMNDEDKQGFQKTFNYVYQEIGVAKVDCLREYLGTFFETNAKFIVFAHHQQVLDAIEIMVSKDFKALSIRIDGNVKSEDRLVRVKQFQEDHQVKVAILSIQAASHGITLTASSHVIFAELYPVPAIMLQAEDRAHRINQLNDVLCHYLIAKDTIDERIFSLLQQKFQTTSKFIDGASAALEIHESQEFQCGSQEQQCASEGKQLQEMRGNLKTLNLESQLDKNGNSIESSTGSAALNQNIENISGEEQTEIQRNEKLPFASRGNSEKLSVDALQAILADDDEDSFEKEAEGLEDKEIGENQDDINPKEQDKDEEGDKERAGIIAQQLAMLRQQISDDSESYEEDNQREDFKSNGRIVDLRKISDDSDSEEEDEDGDWQEKERNFKGQEELRGKLRDGLDRNGEDLESEELDIIEQLRQCRTEGCMNLMSNDEKIERQLSENMDNLRQEEGQRDCSCNGGKEEQQQLQGGQEQEGNRSHSCAKEIDKERQGEVENSEDRQDENSQRDDEDEEELTGEECMIVINDVDEQEEEEEEDENEEEDNNQEGGVVELSVHNKQIQSTDGDNHNSSNNTTNEESISFNEVIQKPTKSINDALTLIQSNEHSDSSDESDPEFCKEQLLRLSKNIKQIGQSAQITITKRSRQEFEEDSFVSPVAGVHQIAQNQQKNENDKNYNTHMLPVNLKKIKKI